jgi:peroxiredoxin (alkyl hydroperoxide reductase subunit C)
VAGNAAERRVGRDRLCNPGRGSPSVSRFAEVAGRQKNPDERGKIMTIKVGDKLPSVKLTRWGEGGPEAVTTDDLFRGKKVALFGVPGAFTPTCSAKHLPGFVQQADTLKAKGVDAVVCTSVNDVFVMNAWGKEQKCGEKVTMVADGDAAFTKATGLELDLGGKGLGLRSQRFSMLVDDGTVKVLNIDPPGAFDKTSAETLLSQI